MADLSIFFEPVDISLPLDEEEKNINRVYKHIPTNDGSGFPELEGAAIALFGVLEDRQSIDNKGCGKAPDVIRHFLYRLYKGDWDRPVVDLGNIRGGESIDDTYFAVSSVIGELVKKGIVPVILGGGQNLTYANYLAYEKLEQTVNMVTVDNSFDLGDVDGPLDSKSFLGKIILHQPNFLFNYGNIGHQTYFVDRKILELIEKLYFDAHRLGVVQSNLKIAEPVIRNADIVSMDLAAIRASDAPGCGCSTPNGFYGEEACQLAWYAGMSDKLSSIGFYEFNPDLDRNGQTGHLVAQMVWYFIEGFFSRKKDFPVGTKKGYLKYRIPINDSEYELVFMKSNRSDRWWIEVPYPSGRKTRYERHHMVPCSYEDYELAKNSEMPDIWWRTYQKLS